jgi:hypothetical protein
MKKIISALLVLVMTSGVIWLPGCQSRLEPEPSPIKSFEENTLEKQAAGIYATSVEPDPDGVELKEVGFAADSTYIMVNFKAPAKIAQNWFQGSIYVIDEGNGKVYSNIPVAPVIGPLFAKPQHDIAPGYVMLNNSGSGIKSGSIVTAVLGKYKRVHVLVK